MNRGSSEGYQVVPTDLSQEGWEFTVTQEGVAVYSHPEFNGCVQLDLEDGTATVFPDQPEEPGVIPEPLITHYGFVGSDGEKQLSRAVFFVYRHWGV